MNDDIINGIMQRGLVLKVLGGATAATRQAIGKHDLAQREALARVEAELRIERMALAEAIDLIGQVLASGELERTSPTLHAKLESCVTYNAQAEQQEAPPGWSPCSPDLLKSGVCCESAPRIAGRPGSGVSHYHPAPKQEAQGAQAGEFQREDRYIVIKRKDLDAAPFGVRVEFQEALDGLVEHLPKRECLVIESDWPEYEPTWAAIQARVAGQGAQAGDLACAVRVLLEVPQLQGEQAFSAQPIIDRVRAALATQPDVQELK